MANISKPLNQGFAAPNIVANYGPYSSVAAAHTALSEDGLNVVGMTVGIKTGDTITEYWYQGGTTQSHLVQKHVSNKELDALDSKFTTAINNLETITGNSLLVTRFKVVWDLLDNAEDIDTIINKFNEIVSFLEGIDENKKLKPILDGITSLITEKANKNDVYLKSETYTKDEVDAAIEKGVTISTTDSQTSVKLVEGTEFRVEAGTGVKVGKWGAVDNSIEISVDTDVLATKTELTAKADKSDTYTKEEVDAAIEDVAFLGENDGQAVIPEFDPQTDTLLKTTQSLTNTEKETVIGNILDKNYIAGSYVGKGKKYLKLNVGAPVATDFDGFVDGATTEQSSLAEVPDNVYFDRTNNIFIASKGEGLLMKYYMSWQDGNAYMNPNSGVYFKNGDNYYQWNGTTLEAATADNVNKLTQADFDSANTIYVIRYDFDLCGQSITIPENCVLEFDGGSLSNGTVFFNDTKLTSDVKLSDIVFGNLPNNNYIDVTWFGVKGDNITDNSTTINFVIDLINTLNTPCTLYFPKGHYKYSTIHNLKCNRLNITGSAPEEVFLICTGTGYNYGTGNAAFAVDIFSDPNDAHHPYFITNLKNLVVVGNPENIKRTIFAQGVAYSVWENVYAFNASESDGVNFYLAGVQISSFKMCGCHTYIPEDTGIEFKTTYAGWDFEYAVRAGVAVAACAANNLDRCHSKHSKIGWLVRYADQCQWLCGSAEQCVQYGFLFGKDSKYCTLIGVGCENIHKHNPDTDDNTVIDILDGATNNVYTGCYVANYMNLQGKGTKVDNLYCTGLQINSAAKNITIKNINYSYFSYGPVNGIQDSGEGTISYNLNDCSNKPTIDYGKTVKINDKTVVLGGNFSGDLNNPELTSHRCDLSMTGKFTTPVINCMYQDFDKEIDTVKHHSGFLGIINNDGVGIGVDREGLTSPSSQASFRLYSKVTDSSRLHFIKRYIKNNAPEWGEEHVLSTFDDTVEFGTTDARNALSGTSLKPWRLFSDLTIKRLVQWNEHNWQEADGATAGVKRSGTFSQRPSASDIYVGFAFFCTDKQTVEGTTDGIIIYHKGNDVWVDALGRTIS